MESALPPLPLPLPFPELDVLPGDDLGFVIVTADGALETLGAFGEGAPSFLALGAMALQSHCTPFTGQAI